MSNITYDLAVIGGGPGGYSAAIYAAQKGLNVILFEGEHIGGTCLNVGCIPTKYLLDKAKTLEQVRSLIDKKIIKDAGLFSFKKIQEGRKDVVKKLVGGVEYLLKANRITQKKGFATLKGVGVIACDGEEFRAKDVIIATGSEPATIPIPGVEHTINSTQALSLLSVPRHLVVIGGGVIGLELASAYCSYGAKVTVIEVLPELFPVEEGKLVALMSQELKKRGIQIHCGTRVEKIEQTDGQYVIYSKNESETMVVKADQVVMATGRKPRLGGIDAGKLGIELTAKGEIKVDEYLQTTLPRVYAVGDVVGGYQLAHAAYAEGEVAVEHILGSTVPVDLGVMPRCIYTMPALAAVGISSKQAKDRGIDVVCGEFNYTANGMALAEGVSGLVHVVMDKNTQKTLGIQIVGECASEMIAFATLAVKDAMTLKDWQKLIVAHPSLSEMIREAALDCFGLSIHGTVKR